jgi:hypothetical protein
MNFYQVSSMSRDAHTKCNKRVTIFRFNQQSCDFKVTSSSQCWRDAEVFLLTQPHCFVVPVCC